MKLPVILMARQRETHEATILQIAVCSAKNLLNLSLLPGKAAPRVTKRCAFFFASYLSSCSSAGIDNVRSIGQAPERSKRKRTFSKS